MGVISRFSRSLISAENYDELYTSSVIALNEFNVDGYLLITTEEIHKNLKLGGGCSKEVIRDILDDKSEQKVRTLDSCFRICTPSITLVGCNRIEAQDEVSLDFLSTICDIAQEYIDQLIKIDTRHLGHKHSQLSAADRVHNVLQCISFLSDYLIEQSNHIVEDLHFNLLKMFPCLSLDYDQEEQIIHLIESTSERMKSLVSAQIRCNRDLEDTLTETVSALIIDFEDNQSTQA